MNEASMWELMEADRDLSHLATRGISFEDLWSANEPLFQIKGHTPGFDPPGSEPKETVSLASSKMSYRDAANWGNFISGLNSDASRAIGSLPKGWAERIQSYVLLAGGSGRNGETVAFVIGESQSVGNWQAPGRRLRGRYRDYTPSSRFLQNVSYGSSDAIRKFIGEEIAGVVVDDSQFDDAPAGKKVTVYRGISLPTGSDPRSITNSDFSGAGASWTLDLNTAKAIAERGRAGFEGHNQPGDGYAVNAKDSRGTYVPTIWRAQVTIGQEGDTYRPWSTSYSSEREVDIPRGTEIVIDGVMQAESRPVSAAEKRKAEESEDQYNAWYYVQFKWPSSFSNALIRTRAQKRHTKEAAEPMQHASMWDWMGDPEGEEERAQHDAELAYPSLGALLDANPPHPDSVRVASQHKTAGPIWDMVKGVVNPDENDFESWKTLPSYDWCFSGDTEFLTYEGYRTFKEVAGTTQLVLDGRGFWVEAPVASFGVQPLRKITLKKGRGVKVIHATGDHRWLVSGKRVRTDDLMPGQALDERLPRSYIDNWLPSPFGIAHGIVFGDGTLGNENKLGFRPGPSRVNLWGEKDAQLLKFFAECQVVPVTGGDNQKATGVQVRGLPRHFKSYPSLDSDSSYLYGWLAGYFAADGRIGANGSNIEISSASLQNLEFVQAVCNRLTIASHDIRVAVRSGCSGRGIIHDYRMKTAGVCTLCTVERNIYSVALVPSTLRPEFFLIDEHRGRFLSRCDGSSKTNLGRWCVDRVEETSRREEVFCVVVGSTESFVLQDNILTSNCRFRRDTQCYYPHLLDEEHSRIAGYAVWFVDERGACWRRTWDKQRACPVSEPGPNSRQPDALIECTRNWDDGGQRDGKPRPAMKPAGAKTAAWSDVRAKAQAIRAAGGVRIIDVSGMQITAEVKSTTGNVYQPSLLLGPNKKVDYWLCTCAWQAYAWERTGKWRKYEGRQCAHALALLYEVQSQGMFGREIGTESGHDEPITFYEPPSRVAVLSSSLWWRIHDRERPFTIDDATSTTFNSGVTSIGYSAFKNPWHLFLYLNANRMYQDGRIIIGFSGKRIGTGADGEDLIMPDMVTVQRFDLPGFERELATTPLPDSPKFADGWWGHSSWAEERRNFSDFELGEDPVIDHIIQKAAGGGWQTIPTSRTVIAGVQVAAAGSQQGVYRGALIYPGDDGAKILAALRSNPAEAARMIVIGMAQRRYVNSAFLISPGGSGVGEWWTRDRATAERYASTDYVVDSYGDVSIGVILHGTIQSSGMAAIRGYSGESPDTADPGSPVIISAIEVNVPEGATKRQNTKRGPWRTIPISMTTIAGLPRTANHPREPAVSWQDKVSALPNTSAWDMIINDAEMDVEERGISEQDDPETFWREVYQQAVTEGSAKGLSTTGGAGV